MDDRQDKPKKPRWRWFQFSLRTLMLFVVVASLPLAWMGNQARKHRQAVVEARMAVTEIESLGGFVDWEVYYGSIDSRRDRPTWLEKLFGDPGVPYIHNVDFFEPSKFADDDMVLLKGMTELQQLSLDNTQVTDAGLVHLKELTELGDLHLDNTLVSDAGLVHLKELTELYLLSLDGTQVTDAGLLHLKGLTRLDNLHLKNTLVSDAGVKDLQQALPDCKIVRTAR